MCPGNRASFISPFFFHEIRNINTGALIEFIKPSEAAKEDEHIKGEVTEESLPPPEGATGFSHIKREKVSDPDPDNIHNPGTILHLVPTPPTQEHTQPDPSFQTRLLVAQSIIDDRTREGEFIKLAKEWIKFDIKVVVPLTPGDQEKKTPTKSFSRELVYLIQTPIHNNYVGMEWKMPNGLKVIIKQGDLVNETTEVIVNPANSLLIHGGGAAKAISMAAGPSLAEHCRHYVNRYGALRIGEVVHTTAGILRLNIKYVIHAVGPDAKDNQDRQNCFDIVTRTIGNCLKYAEHTLKSVSISLLAISAGIFEVPIRNVAHALYKSLLEFDYERPACIKEVHIVNIDSETTDIVQKEFKGWFAQITKSSQNWLLAKVLGREVSHGLYTGTHVVQIHAHQDRKSTEDTVDSETGKLGERKTDILDEKGRLAIRRKRI